MNENLPYIWRKNYRNEAASPEKVLEIAHEQAREYLSRAVATASRSPAKSPTLDVGLLKVVASVSAIDPAQRHQDGRGTAGEGEFVLRDVEAPLLHGAQKSSQLARPRAA